MNFIRNLFGRSNNARPGNPVPAPRNNGAVERMDRKVSILGTEEVARDQWTGQMDFLMSLIAYAVGLGRYSLNQGGQSGS